MCDSRATLEPYRCVNNCASFLAVEQCFTTGSVTYRQCCCCSGHKELETETDAAESTTEVVEVLITEIVKHDQSNE